MVNIKENKGEKIGKYKERREKIWELCKWWRKEAPWKGGENGGKGGGKINVGEQIGGKSWGGGGEGLDVLMYHLAVCKTQDKYYFKYRIWPTIFYRNRRQA